MTSFDKAFEQVKQLTEKFHSNHSYYSSPTYQEAEARKDFIDKFFMALGWDVNHDEQHNPYEQEVKVEKGQKQAQATAQKRADYAFYTAPNFKDVKFFVEAKKPAVELKHPDNYFQTIRYGWNANTPIAILTDFEQFHIIDCRYKPDIRYVFNGQHKEYRFTDYTDKEKFAELYWLFSREAVLNNSLQKYGDSLPKPKGKKVSPLGGGLVGAAIDDSFLEYIDNIREELAKAFKKNDERLGSEALTEAVTRTIDRLVFIRFLEDKLIEPNNHVSEWRSWKDFIADCRRLDVKYNGVVFKEHPLLDKKGFAGAEEKMFLDICSDISNLNSPYDFNYIPIHILGSIYERFLGKVVVATDHRVRIEEKPEVRKAGGVYYTPKYIVDYIVKNTIWPCIENKTPKEIASLRFADIACGSGSFLIGVYDYLLDYHKKYYQKKYADRAEPIDARNEDFVNVEYKDKQWLLTLKLKQDILLNNIYGVDIDRQAVEVTQLSLFLKMLEEETTGSIQLKLLSKVLPDLSKNIVCGNSLIGTDYWNKGHSLDKEIMIDYLFSPEEELKLKPMDFEDAFPSIMKNGGFDAIVGNPPYGMVTDEKEKQYFLNSYSTVEGRFDKYELFLESALVKLKVNGLLGYIIPSPILTNLYTKKLRRFLLEQFSIKEIINFEFPVFNDPTVHTCIFLIQNQKQSNNSITIKQAIQNATQLFNEAGFGRPQKEFLSVVNFAFDIYSDLDANAIIDKMNQQGKILGSICYIRQCIKTGNDTIYVKNSETFISEPWKPSLRGKSIGRYSTSEKSLYLRYGDWLARNWKNKSFYETPKIAIRETGNRITATIDLENRYFLSSLYAIYYKTEFKIDDLKYLLGIINSSLANYFMKVIALNLTKGAFTKVRTNQLARLPIKSQEGELNNKVISLVTQMLEAKKQIASVKTEGDKDFLENKCNSLDRQIDRLVYQLYELTDEEIKIVEGV